MVMADGDRRKELDGWMEPFLAALQHEKRRRRAPVYVRGLLGPGERKSLQPTAARPGLTGHDRLRHFIASTARDDAPLRRILVEKADGLAGGSEAVLVIDDTALPEQGRRSVGVARRYCGCLGKHADCQVLVSLTLARGEVPVPVGLRLFLPGARAAEGERLRDGRRPPGEEIRLVGEHRASGERKYCPANPPSDTTLETLAATIKARWICEQAHQQLEEAERRRSGPRPFRGMRSIASHPGPGCTGMRR
jgi:SRSO17 transposase